MLAELLWRVGAFLLALGVLVIIHELGHYWAARCCGVRVLRFCVGFGRPIASVRRGQDQTEWALAAIPLGGYVQFLDENEAKEPVAPSERHRAFNRQPLHYRAFIVAAGPLANLFLAVLLYGLMFVVGVEEPRAVIAAPPSGTLAAGAGLHEKDRVQAIDGQPIVSWLDLRWRVLQGATQQKTLTIDVLRDHTRHVALDLDLSRIDTADLDARLFEQIGLALYLPPVPAVIGQVQLDSPAQQAGLRPGDRVLSIAGQPVQRWQDMAQIIARSPGERLSLVLMREGERIPLHITPQADPQRKGAGRIGVSQTPGALSPDDFWVLVRYGPVEAVSHAVHKTLETAVFSLRMLGKMILGEASLKNLSGPVTIADYAGQSAQLGLNAFLGFLALISISLGVLNLLPIPLLDGGHLLYYLAEFLRGKPVSERVMDIGQRVGMGILATLMVFAFYNDLTRLFLG